MTGRSSERSDYRWSLVPDADGTLHLVDLNTYDESVEPHFDAENDMIFLLFTRRNPTVGQEITWNLESLQNSQFDPSHPTRFSIHGWVGSRESRVNTDVRAAYFQYGEYNVSV